MSVPETALVTGAASGIGLALSQLLTQRGCRTFLFDVDDQALPDVGERLPAERAVVGDVADASALERLADEIGPVDLLCLNAGVISTSQGPPWEASPEEWDRVLGVNLLGVVNGLRAFVPLMIERHEPSHILITASLAGVATWPGGGPYAASKHAVFAVAEQTAFALADTTVDVTVLCPALVRSAMSSEGEDPLVVAAQGLAAVGTKQFAVMPEEWRSAVKDRTAAIVAGEQPNPPTIADQTLS